MFQDFYHTLSGGILDWESFCFGFYSVVVFYVFVAIVTVISRFFLALIKRFIYPGKKED